MAIPEQAQKGKKRTDDLAGRLGALLQGRSVERVLKADSREMALQLSDGTRLFVRAEGQLDISVT
jgi:hypothetical protein